MRTLSEQKINENKLKIEAATRGQEVFGGTKSLSAVPGDNYTDF